MRDSRTGMVHHFNGTGRLHVDGEIWLNMGPGMHFAPEPWVNVEAIHRDNHPRPALIVEPGESLLLAVCAEFGPDAGERVTRIYAGHCMEHVEQHLLHQVATQWFDLIAPGGELGICQPDFYKALQYWKDGLIDMTGLMRHGDVGDVWPEDRWEQWYRDGELDSYAMHSWNSIPERVHGLLRAVGFVVEPREPTREGMAGWPLTGFGGAQLACVARKP